MDKTKDRFSVISNQYAQFRPEYPLSLYKAILEYVPVRDLALDCGTGNGQAAKVLAGYFSTVYATDISPAAQRFIDSQGEEIFEKNLRNIGEVWEALLRLSVKLANRVGRKKVS